MGEEKKGLPTASKRMEAEIYSRIVGSHPHPQKKIALLDAGQFRESKSTPGPGAKN